MKTDKELDQAIYEKQARIEAAVKDGWKRLVNQGRAAYEKNGKYLDMNANPCPDPNANQPVKRPRKGQKEPTLKISPAQTAKRLEDPK